MATLKQVLIAVAAAAVSVLASPLTADAAATSIVDAPVSAVTEISKPLKGKELEDFMAGWPHTPAGSVDITNTTLAAELIKFYEAHKSGTALTKRGGACNQGTCPDFYAAFDLLEQHWYIPFSGTVADYWQYNGRWNDCGQCGKVETSSDGCFDFTSCGRPQNICIDTNNNRAHRIWKDNGDRSCYSIQTDHLGGCGYLLSNGISHPIAQVACTW